MRNLWIALLTLPCICLVMCSSNRRNSSDEPVATQGPAATQVDKKGGNMNDTIRKSEEEWKKELTPEQYRVLREKGTERPFTGEYEKNWSKGTYVCAACGNVLFHSDTKFDAGCGWPSFYREAAKGHIIEHADYSLGMRRTEIICARCGGHLGHVFDDGPKETGLRYCVNSVSLKFIPAAKDSTK